MDCAHLTLEHYLCTLRLEIVRETNLTQYNLVFGPAFCLLASNTKQPNTQTWTNKGVHVLFWSDTISADQEIGA